MSVGQSTICAPAWPQAGRRLITAMFGYYAVIPVVLSTVLSAGLVHRKFGLFSTGFLSTHALSGFEFVQFFAVSILADLTLLCTLFAALSVLAHWRRWSTRRFAMTAIVSGSLVVASMNVISFHVLNYLGDFLQVRTAANLANGELLGGGSYVLQIIPWNSLALVTVLACVFGFVAILKRLADCAEFGWQYRPRRIMAGGLSLWCLSAIASFWLSRNPSQNVAVAASHICSYHVLSNVMSGATDFDGDGIGWLHLPPDTSPFDAKRHPYAIDIPGNGVDENGLGGDLRELKTVPRATVAATAVHRPDIVLVVPCSLRYDAVFGGSLGASSMPYLRALADQGVSPRAYSHTGYTTSSLRIINTGFLTTPEGSLVSDFKQHGYQVAVFSAQDDRFGGTRESCEFERADYYFDASMAPDDRMTPYSFPGSLQLPAGRLIEEMERYLPQARSDQPLLIIAYIASVHFPYTLDSPQTHIAHSKLDASEMRSDRRAEVVACYRNATANLDNHLRRMFEVISDHRQGPAVKLIIADHGEELFEEGKLGHGLACSELQTRIPCIIADAWGEIPEPFSQSDVRPFLNRLVGTVQKTDGLTIQPRPDDQPVFQWCGSLRLPSEIAHVLPGRHIRLNLSKQTVRVDGGPPLDLRQMANDLEVLSLIHHWESLRWEMR